MNERRWGGLALLVLLSVYFAFAFHGAHRTAVTVDELGHLPSGLLYIETGDPRFASLNPPLVNVISALPVMGALSGNDRALLEPSDDPFSFWENGYRFMEENRSRYLDLMNRARRGPIVVVALLGVLLFFWAGRLNPEAPVLAGVLAAGLVLLSPNVLAQARLVGTDTGTAFFVVLSVFTFGLFLKRPTLAFALCAGLALGLAQLTKFYALLLYPSFLILMIFRGRASEPSSDPIMSPRSQGWALVAMVLVSLVVLNTGYLWSEFSAPLSDVTLQSPLMRSLSSSVLGTLPLPLPAAYLRAFDGQLVEVGSGMPSVLWGERFQGGRWDYFLGLLAIKTPIAIVLAFGVAVFGALRGHGLPRRESMLLWVYPVLLFVFLSLGDRRQLGARALLSAVPFVALWTASVFARTVSPRWRWASAALVLVGLAMTSFASHPHHLAYFNSLVGGRDHGYQYVSDANIDIGQGLVGLADYLAESGEESVQLLYFGSVDPELYGIDYVVPEPGELKPGLLAVSVSLYSLRYPMYDHGTLRPVGPVNIPLDPIASIGGSIHVFRIDP